MEDINENLAKVFKSLNDIRRLEANARIYPLLRQLEAIINELRQAMRDSMEGK